MKFARIILSTVLALYSTSEIEAIQLKTFDARLYGKANLDELKDKNLGYYSAVQMFKDVFRSHYDDLRIMNPNSYLLNDDSYKYFLTLYDVIPNEIAKAMFEIEIEGDSVNYVNKNPNQIIECSSKNYKSISDYDDANWNYLLLVNVINRIMNSPTLVCEPRTVSFVGQASQNLDRYYRHKYTANITKATTHITQYFNELHLYEFLGNCYYLPHTMQEVQNMLLTNCDDNGLSTNHLTMNLTKNHYSNNYEIMAKLMIKEDNENSYKRFVKRASDSTGENRYKVLTELPTTFAKFFKADTITQREQKIDDENANIIITLKQCEVPRIKYRITKKMVKTDTKITDFNGVTHTEKTIPRPVNEYSSLDKYNDIRLKPDFEEFYTPANINTDNSKEQLGSHKLTEQELYFFFYLCLLVSKPSTNEYANRTNWIKTILKSAEQNKLSEHQRILLNIFNMYLYYTNLLPDIYESIYLRLTLYDKTRLKRQLNTVMRQISGKALSTMTFTEIEKEVDNFATTIKSI